jgi:putative ABC transport system substrate-binding protein
VNVRLSQQAGTYVARILNGQKPADIPVTRAATFKLVINLATAKSLGISVPSTLLTMPNEIIK